MKTKFTTLLISLFPSLLIAQIPNSSFELTNQCNLTSYWSYMPLQAFIIDSAGNTITDSIVWDGVNALNMPVPDAHTGSKAISLRNAYSYNTGQKYIGQSTLYPDSSECVAFFQTLLPINYSPMDFSFYYKYAPVNADTAYAIALLYDQFGTEVARAEQWLIGAQINYIQNITSFAYSSSNPVAFYSISFSNMIPDGYPHQSTFGTRLTIDDVSFQGNTSLENTDPGVNISLFPNPASEVINISVEEDVIVEQMIIINSWGQTVQIKTNPSPIYNCNSLDNGIYQMKLITNKGITNKKFVKE